MADESRKSLTSEELENQEAEPLPDREAMSVVSLEPQPIHDLEVPHLERDADSVPGQIDY